MLIKKKEKKRKNDKAKYKRESREYIETYF